MSFDLFYSVHPQSSIKKSILPLPQKLRILYLCLFWFSYRHTLSVTQKSTSGYLNSLSKASQIVIGDSPIQFTPVVVSFSPLQRDPHGAFLFYRTHFPMNSNKNGRPNRLRLPPLNYSYNYLYHCPAFSKAFLNAAKVTVPLPFPPQSRLLPVRSIRKPPSALLLAAVSWLPAPGSWLGRT